MNIAKFILLGMLFLLTYTLKAQDTLYNQRLGLAVKTDILATAFSKLIFGAQSYSLSVEKLIGKKQSFQLSGYYSFYNNNPDDQTNYRAFQIIPEYRLYLNKKNWHKGMYCGIYSGLIDQHEFIPNGNYDLKFRFIELGAQSGYQTYLFKHFVIDFLLGFGAKKTISPKNISPDGHIYSNQRAYYLDGRLYLNIGYIFY